MAQRKGGRPAPAKSGMTRKRRRSLVVGVVVLVLVGVLGWWAWRSTAEMPGQTIPSLGNAHLVSQNDPHVPYNSDAPTSGPHLSYIAPWGIHTKPIPKELQVHNLEDGGVLVQYNCDCPELVAKLRAIVERYKNHVILAPYPGMKQKIALTAWGRIDGFDEFDEARVTRFVSAYRGIDHHAR